MFWLYIGLILAVLLVLFLWRSAYERKTLSVSEYKVTSSRLPEAFDGTVFVYLSDLHDDVYGEKNEELIRRIKALSPEMLLIGGDMTSAHVNRNKAPFQSFEYLLDAFQDIPLYFACGNHELRILEEEELEAWRPLMEKVIRDHHMNFLKDSRKKIEKNGSYIEICGIDLDWQYYLGGRKRKLPEGYIEEKLGAPGDAFKILLSHSPLYMEELTDWGADVVLSGHFHGGTIRLPLLGGVMTPQYQFFSKYCRGEVKCEKGVGIVSGGLGTHSINIRINNKPDIVRVELRRE